MKTLVCYSKENIKIENTNVPVVGKDEVLIRTILCGLCGSDIVKIMSPDVKKPVKLGHEAVGVVEKVGPEVKKARNAVKKGDIVAVTHHIPCYSCIYCDHGNYSMCSHFRETNLDPQGFSEYIKLSGEHVKYNTFVVENKKIIKNVIFTEPTACCLRAVKRVDIKNNDIAMVVGCGTIGIIFISLFKLLYNAKVIAVDIDSKKLKYAKKFGADLTINSKKENIREKVSKFSSTGVDIVELTVTTPQTTRMAMDNVRPGGHIQIFAGPAAQHEISINFEHLYKKELTILSSYSATPEASKESFYYLKDYRLDFRSLISEVLPIDQFEKGLDLALSQKTFKVLYYFDKNLVKNI